MTTITLTPRAEREQRTFRQLLTCMSRPGTLGMLPVTGAARSDETSRPSEGGRGSSPLSMPWAGAIVALEALVDHEVTFCVVPERTELSDVILRQTGSRLAALEDADYVLCDAERLADTLRRASDGTLEYPDHGATVVCQVQGLSATETAGLPLLLSGPGIKDSARVWVDGIDAAACRAFIERNAGVPLGVDLVMVSPEGAVCCLPRYTRLELETEGK